MRASSHRSRRVLWAVWLTAFLLTFLYGHPAIAVTDQNQPDAQFRFESPWQYQWGDSPVDKDGRFVRLSEPLNSPGWNTVTAPESIVDRNGRDVLWIRTVVPVDRCNSCAIYADSIDQVFELYLNGILVTKTGTIQEGMPVQYSGNLLNLYELPVETLRNAGQTSAVLTLRIQSESEMIGLSGQILYGEYSGIVRILLKSQLSNVLIGILSLMIGAAVLFMAYRFDNQKIYTSFGFFSLVYGFYLCVVTEIMQFIYPYPLVFGYLQQVVVHLLPITFYLLLYYLLGPGKWRVNYIAYLTHIILGIFVFVGVISEWLAVQESTFLLQLTGIFTVTAVILSALIEYPGYSQEKRWFLQSSVVFLLFSMHDLFVSSDFLPYRFYLSSYGMLIMQGMLILIFVKRLLDNRSQYQRTAFIAEEQNEEIRQQNTQLIGYSEMLEQKTNDLRKKNDELVKVNEIKDQILANTSHELRTPINGIIGIAESMMDSLGDDFHSDMRRNLGMIVSSGRRLSNLVNDILDYSRMRNNQLTLRVGKVDVNIVSNLVIELCRPLIGSKLIELRNELEPDFPLVNADENRLHQILYNLVSNAIKFTPSGEIIISGKRSGDFAEITVRDTGIGIPPEKQAAIFHSFEQADGSMSREYGGTGLGLAVTKQLVLLQGGDIRVESEVHKFSAFTFTLPIYLETDVSNVMRDGNQAGNRMIVKNEELPAWTGGQAKMDTDGEYNILIVDDEPLNIQVIINHLMPLNYGITTATDGIEALAYLHGGKTYDLVLLDVMMPRMSGYEVCERIRSKFQANELPVIILTAKNATEDLVRGFQVGANDYLPKPFARQELIARIQTHLKLTRQHRSLKVMKERLEQLLDRRNETGSNG